MTATPPDLPETDLDADVIVIGAGAAGLAGATTLARARRRVLAIDAGEPRNAPAAGVHGFLGHDGIAPGELLARGRAELAAYGGRLVAGRAVSARATGHGFEVDLEDGSSYTGRRVLVTTGSVDELPDVPGLAEHWGSAVLHCPYCHGWEVRDRALALIATGPISIGHGALLWSQWTDDLTVLLHDQPAPDAEVAARLGAAGVRVLPGLVQRVVTDDGTLVGLEVDGEVVACDAVVVQGVVRARSAVLDALGLGTVEFGVPGQLIGTHVAADPTTGQTTVPGVYVAGNTANPMGQVITAASAATTAAMMLNMELVEEDVARVLAG